MITQELINHVSGEMKKGNDYFAIQKALMRSEFKTKDIQESYRLISIVGPENVDSNFLDTIKKDKLYLKKHSGLSAWFNTIVGLLLVTTLVKAFLLFT